MAYIPIKGYMPDADPTEPGVLVDVDNFVPTLNGMRSLPSEVSAQTSQTIASLANSLAMVEKRDITDRRVFASTINNIYELTAGAWASRVPTAAASGTGSAVSISGSGYARFIFTQYEDETYAAHKGAPLLRSGSVSKTFTAVTGAPKGSIVERVDNFLFLFDIDDTSYGPAGSLATYGSDSNRWWCSGLGLPNSWTINVATQATTGHLTDTSGGITAGKRLGSDIVVYKQQAMYLGRYIGAPKAWHFSAIPGEGLGTWSKFSVVNIETAHLFAGYDNFYIFDGTRPVAIGTNRVADLFLSTLNVDQAKYIVAYHDRPNWRVFWWYPTGGGTSGGAPILDRYLCYNYRSDRWGGGSKTILSVGSYAKNDSLTYDGLSGVYGDGTYDQLPEASYDLAFREVGQPQMSVIVTGVTTTQSVLRTLDGISGASQMTTGDFGTDGVTSVVTRIRPRFRTVPTTGSHNHYIKNIESVEPGTQVSTGSMSDQGSFDTVFAARWHRQDHIYSGDVEVMGFDIQIAQDGEE